jgi:hypothetical protein
MCFMLCQQYDLPEAYIRQIFFVILGRLFVVFALTIN